MQGPAACEGADHFATLAQNHTGLCGTNDLIKKITRRLEEGWLLLAHSFLLVGANCFAREKKKIF